MILLTGATGFLGSRIAKMVIDEGGELACICRAESSFDRVASIYKRIVWINNDETSIIRLFESSKIDIIIHCATEYGRAGQSLNRVYDANVRLPMFLYDLAIKHNVRLFINTDTFFCDELKDGWVPGEKVYLNNYVKSKFFFKEMISSNIDDYDISFINMKLHHIYGENDISGKFIPFLVQSLKENVESIELSAGIQKRDWIYIDDVVDAYRCVIRKRDLFKVRTVYLFEVGTGIETTLKEFCVKMKEVSGANTKLLFGKKQMNSNELMSSVADNSLLKSLGWNPKYGIDKGINKLFGL